jgi:protein-tyrosine phosphatase
MGRVDLHCHLLPGVDDGPASMAQSLELARAAATDGTAVAAATAHVRPDFVTDVSVLPGLVAELREALAAEEIPLAIVCSAELGHEMVGRLSQGELEIVALGPPRGRWLLVETPFERLDDRFGLATDELRDRGFGVVLAHPERSDGILREGLPVLMRELERGSLLQVNAFSLAGAHGDAAREAAAELVASGRAALIGSDGHGGRRPPALSVGVEGAVAAGLAPSAAERLAGAAPARLLKRGAGQAPHHVAAA